MSPLDLSEAVEALAATLGDVVRAEARGGVEFARSGVVFASFGGERLSVRLRSEIAAAALRTPDTARSDRGEGWIEGAPERLDGFALDRARAWFESAWRYAAEAGDGGAERGGTRRLN